MVLHSLLCDIIHWYYRPIRPLEIYHWYYSIPTSCLISSNVLKSPFRPSDIFQWYYSEHRSCDIIQWQSLLYIPVALEALWYILVYYSSLHTYPVWFESSWYATSTIGWVFLGWTSAKLGWSFSLNDTTHWRRWGWNPWPLGLESSTLQLSHCAPCNANPVNSSSGTIDSIQSLKYLPVAQ